MQAKNCKTFFHPLSIMMNSKSGIISKLGHYLAYLWKYRNMLYNLVKKDFQGKYRHSSLGYLWHLIMPLSLIVVYFVVFSNIFGRNIPNYWLYLSSAVFTLNLFSSSMIGGTNAITSNAGMVSKMMFPRELLIFSNVAVNLINCIISYSILIIVMLFAGIKPSINLIYVPLILFLVSGFAIGVGLILGSLNVYIRDISSGISIIQMLLIFITPCFYVVEDMSELVQNIVKINPLSYFVESMHDAIYYASSPELTSLIICIIISLLFFVVGLMVFKKIEKNFVDQL